MDGINQNGDTLEGRTVLMHVRTNTVIECIALDDFDLFDFKGKQHQFKYTNSWGVVENHLFVLHYSLQDELMLKDVFTKAEKFYTD